LNELKKFLELSLRRLLKGAKEGNLEEVSAVLDQQPTVTMKCYCLEELGKLMNVIGSDGWNALHYACFYGNEEVVAEFLGRDA
jgi:ankyrin repeat protein